MRLSLLGVNHHSAPVSVRERLSLSADQQSVILPQLRALPSVDGAMILSTCNRTELYLAHAETGSSDEVLQHYLAARGQSADAGFFYRHEDEIAVRHVFRVATGLDSMVLGEPQILGQLKAAYTSAKAANTLAPALDHLLQQSFHVAKQTRTLTGLGENSVSVASAAVRLSKEFYDDFDRRTALIIGAGETATLIGRHLKAQGIRKILISNRTFSRAQTLAESLDAQAVLLSQLDQHLIDADMVITATAASQPIIKLAHIERAIKQRKRRTLLLIDLSVPRNIAPEVKDARDVYLYSVDDLKVVTEAGQQARVEAAKAAQVNIEEHVADFMRWLKAREHFEPIVALRNKHFALRDEALAAAKRRLETGHDPAAELDRLAHLLTNQFLHAPTIAMKDAAARDQQAILDAASRLFKLD
jgi:glutamyl-tRNA reductase